MCYYFRKPSMPHNPAPLAPPSPGVSVGKESIWDTGDTCSTPGLGRSPGGGHGNPLQYSCRGNPKDRGAWRATVHRATKSQTWLTWLSTHFLMTMYRVFHFRNSITFKLFLLMDFVLFSILWLGEGNGNPLQYSCLGNPMDRGAWWAAVHGVAKSRTPVFFGEMST